MKNQDVMSYYDKMAANIKEPTETRNKAKDFSAFDIAFMKERASKDKHLLDLGAGTGLLINAIVDEFGHITAVERYENFSKFIVDAPNVDIINADVLNLDLHLSPVDVLSLFGVMNYFNEDEAKSIYANIKRYLKPTGQLIVKNQLGVHEDVTVAGFSEEIGSNYYSNYRHLDNEIKLLESCGFANVEVFDIYPAEYNRWENTHFYALTANLK
ncbi:class I SAM-dependent methyltransferase [Glaciecola sp. KUL10]|uniref:class I SAM-dependent methyltransferase n=1 Tax=Glaciecola sp. (strain KUL10) TaxID=2161813 RepID=UPI000D78A1BC|nr:class I SAM-dependent methyltransferase [Glaciecola sp. KUL10]GBL04606.1 hypothetical protein KUL10_19130 [Glaciecola sp. KUL10]